MIRPDPINGVITWPDGRELCEDTVAGRAAYAYRLEEMASRQQWVCPICGRIMGLPTFDHQEGRGSGGHLRNDAITNPDGSWRNAALCWADNGLKGSVRYHWTYDGSKRVYVPEA